MSNWYNSVSQTNKFTIMKIVIDSRGPMGSDCTSLDKCHFENPSDPKLCDAINFLLESLDKWGSISVFESYDSKAGALRNCLVDFEYRSGKLLDSNARLRKVGERLEWTNIEELWDKKVLLISVSGGWSNFNYNLCLAQS